MTPAYLKNMFEFKPSTYSSVMSITTLHLSQEQTIVKELSGA